MSITTAITFACSVVLNCTGNLLIKIGMKRVGDIALGNIGGLMKSVILNPALIGGTVSYIVSLGFYMIMLRRVNLSVAYPLYVGCQLIVLTILSVVVLKESVTTIHIIGGAVILLGIALISH
jgi:multidrug transporter EmrE-like cation transporter